MQTGDPRAGDGRTGSARQAQVSRLDVLIRKCATEHGHAHADYYSAMVDACGTSREDLDTDGIHPDAPGCAITTRMVQVALR